MQTDLPMTQIRFGAFELDVEEEQLRRNGRAVRMQPQPFKLLCLLAARPGKLVTREEIRAALWKTETFVDYEQGVNFAIKQVRDALGESAEHPVYIQTVPKRGYKFVAPVASVAPVAEPTPAPPATTPPAPTVTAILQKAMWANIVELRMGQERKAKQVRALTAGFIAVVLVLVSVLIVRGC